MQRESLSRDARAPRFASKVQRPGELRGAKWAGGHAITLRTHWKIASNHLTAKILISKICYKIGTVKGEVISLVLRSLFTLRNYLNYLF